MFCAGRKFHFQQFALHNSTSRQRITGTTFRKIKRSTSCDKESAAIPRYTSTTTRCHIQLSLSVHDYLIHIIIAMGGLFLCRPTAETNHYILAGLDRRPVLSPSVIFHISIGRSGQIKRAKHNIFYQHKPTPVNVDNYLSGFVVTQESTSWVFRRL